MAETETKVEREGAADEESLVIKATASEAPEAKATAPVMVPDAQKQAADSIANAEPSASVLVDGAEEASLDRASEEEVGDEVVEMVQKKGTTNEKGKGKKKVTAKRQKRGAPSKNAQKRQAGRKNKAAGNDGNDDPSDSVLGKVDEHASEVMTMSSEDKAGDGGDNDGKESNVKEVENKDNDGKEDVGDKEKADSGPSKKNKRRKKRNKGLVAAAEAAGTAEVGAVKKLPDTKELAGMIFMCNSETKKDCYRLKIFGMPAGKKEMVAKVYKGMKLFLYDIDLKLLYGIYVAASKGGSNIQPKAFKSAFPSQVRFKVLKDYLPLPQEKFKAAIKGNYFKKHMFNCELSAEQVKNLTKLFVEATKASKLTNDRATRKRTSQSSLSHETKRRRHLGTVSHPSIDQDDRVFLRGHDTYGREAYASHRPLQAPYHLHGSAVPRQAPLPLYSSPPRLAPLPPPPPAYAYERPRDDYYQREPPMELRGHRIIDSEIPLPLRGHRIIDSEIPPPFDHVGYPDAYTSHREPAPYHEPRYPALPSSYYASAPPPYRY